MYYEEDVEDATDIKMYKTDIKCIKIKNGFLVIGL
jgi:hypothetical protein